MTPETGPLKSDEVLSLENCDREPVHIPGRIQSFAVLLATDAKVTKLTWCSANAPELFGKPLETLLNVELSDILGRQIVHTLRSTLSLSSCRVQREQSGVLMLDGVTYDLWVHLSEETPILELERIDAEISGPAVMTSVRPLLGRLEGLDDLDSALNEAVEGLRSVTGFDRVMVIRFDQNGDGEIVAEARVGDMEPFLGLRFPKWDIPNQARDIMRRTRSRIIADIEAENIPMIPSHTDHPPLDMTHAASRGTSEIHLEYLRNMGTRASMTLSIVVEGKLWGMFSFHHATPYHASAAMRGGAELFVQFFCLQIENRLGRKRNQAQNRALLLQKALQDSADHAMDLAELVNDIAPQYCEMVGAKGLMLVGAEKVSGFGLHPEPDIAREIVRTILPTDGDEAGVAASLREHGIDAGPCAGALVLPIESEDFHAIVFFRELADQSITWAGAPVKDIVKADDGPRLKPRGSFKAYLESIQGFCLPWEDEDILVVREIAFTLAKADVTLQRKLSQTLERQRRIYIAELNHRVRNILALIRSLSRRAESSTQSLESYARALEQRIEALGTAHDLAASNVTAGVPLRALFETELEPYLEDRNNQFRVSGGDRALRAHLAPMFMLVAHELVTNCVKYGALSVQGGIVSVAFAEQDGGLNITWTETGGPRLKPPSRRGFGLGLIENAVPYELDGDSTIEFLPTGLVASFWLPGNAISMASEDAPQDDLVAASSEGQSVDFPASVLVVEDSMMIALDMIDILRGFGATDIQSQASVAKACKALSSWRPDFAVLDISLREDDSFEVANRLIEMGVPFLFVTGFGSEYQMMESLDHVPVLTKPVEVNALRRTIELLWGRESST